MTKVAHELGISDVGLAKACRRNSVPVPPRGHWAKIAAGKKSPQPPFPNPHQDNSIELWVTDPSVKATENIKRRDRAVLIDEKVTLLAQHQKKASIDKGNVHPLVRATRMFIPTIPRLERQYRRMSSFGNVSSDTPLPPFISKGRRYISGPNLLALVVSDESVRWAVDTYEQLINTLELAGCTFLLSKSASDSQEAVTCELNGERLYFSLTEGYRKRHLSAEELAKRAKGGQYFSAWDWEPSGKFTWTVVGTEANCNAQLTGTQVQIESKLTNFAATCLHLLEELPTHRHNRIAAERQRELEAAERARLQALATARREQLNLAFRLAEQGIKEEALKKHLDHLESELPKVQDPYRLRLEAWVEMIRHELTENSPYEKLLLEALSGHRWRSGPPDWWPESKEWPEVPSS